MLIRAGEERKVFAEPKGPIQSAGFESGSRRPPFGAVVSIVYGFGDALPIGLLLGKQQWKSGC